MREKGERKGRDLWKGQEGTEDEGVQTEVAKGRKRGVGRAHAPPATGPHAGGAREGGATCEPEDGCLELVVGMVSEGEQGDTCTREGVKEDVVAGITCDALDGARGGGGGEGGDTPGDVHGVVGDTEGARVVGSGGGHVLGGGLEVVEDMDGEEGVGGDELAEEEEETGRVGAGGIRDGDAGAGRQATEGSREFEWVDRRWHVTARV